jgi:hypothetical protein
MNWQENASKNFLTRGHFILSLFLVSFLSHSVRALETVIGTDIENAERKVIRLTIPSEYKDLTLNFEWTRAGDGKRYKLTHNAREGPGLYEMRRHPYWKGRVAFVAVSNDSIKGKLIGEIITPSFSDELAIFFEPLQMEPHIVNGFNDHSLLGVSWNVSLILPLFGLVSLFTFVIKRRLIFSLVLGFAAAWAVVDMRMMYDHFKIAQKIEKDKYIFVPEFTRVQNFVDASSEKIGSSTWTKDSSWLSYPHIYSSVLVYGLAEHKYVPDDPNKAEFLVTIQDGKLSLLRFRTKE